MRHRHRYTGLAGSVIQDWQSKLTDKGTVLFEDHHTTSSQRIIDALSTMRGVTVSTVLCKGGKFNFPAFARYRDKTMLEFTYQQPEEKKETKKAA